MSLWNLIRDFYIQYIFGGTLSSGQFVSIGRVGKMFNNTGLVGNATMDNFAVNVGEQVYMGNTLSQVNYINLGDWLSTTFTIITLILFVFYLFIFLRWLFKTVSGLMLLRN